MWLLTLTLLAIFSGAVEPAAPEPDLRSRIVVRRDCTTELGHAELTLFANGTVRLREGERRHEGMKLAELPPDELAAFVRRLEEIDLTEAESVRAEIQGDWIEACDLELRLEDRAERRFRYGRFDSLPLALSRLLAVVNDLAAVVQTRSPGQGLPRGYRPQSGDILSRADGGRWEVIALTGDGRGVELLGLDEPLTIYVSVEALRGEFTSVVKRRPFP
ncbi:MAG: hypothetical protein V3R89_02155 [Thermoanaerobaculia bacterium]